MPVTIYGSYEMVKFLQARRLEHQKVTKTFVKIHSADHEISCKVLNSRVNENLGQINFILADKTGTLTQKHMGFHRLVIGRYNFFNMQPNPKDPRQIETDKSLEEILLDPGFEGEKTRNAIRCLTLCHSVLFDENVTMYSSSPEDMEFLEFAKNYKYAYQVPELVDNQNFLVVNEQGKLVKYKLLERFDFTPERRRSSVIVSFEEGGKEKICMFTKGADEILDPLLNLAASGEVEAVYGQIEKMSKKGFRILMLTVKKFKKQEWETFHRSYRALIQKTNDIEEIHKKQAELEVELEMLGIVAFEEQIQEKIVDSIKFIRAAKIRTWVATGDKLNTTFSVARRTGLILPNTTILKFKDLDQIKEEVFIEMDSKLRSMPKGSFAACLVDGPYLSQIMEFKKTNVILYEEFVDIVMRAEVAVFARTYPQQKEQVIRMIKESNKKVLVAAIGDAYNDAYMLRAADVGIAIKENDHSQISKISDVSVGDFKSVVPLFFYFGRECYRKNSMFILFNFYKNFLLMLPMVWNGFLNFFSGFSMYDELAFQFYHIIYTLFPILSFTMFDKVYPKVKILFSPLIYQTGIDDFYFSKQKVVETMITGILLSFFLTFTSLSLFDWGTYSNGFSFGYFNYANMCFYGCVIVCNLKIFTVASSYSMVQVWQVILSISLFVGTWFWRSLTPLNDLYQTFWEIIFSYQFILYNMILVGIAMVEYLIYRVSYFMSETKYIPDFDLKFDANADNNNANAETELAISGISDNQEDHFVAAENQKKTTRKSAQTRRKSNAPPATGLINEGEKPKYKPLDNSDDDDDGPHKKKMI